MCRVKCALGSAVSEFQDYLDEEENIKCLSKAARTLRAKISKAVKWKFEKSLSDYDVPKKAKHYHQMDCDWNEVTNNWRRA